MELFDVIKQIFKSDKEWNKVSKYDKTRNFFMINRIMSIQYPLQANQFNHLKITPRPVIDWWHSALSPMVQKQGYQRTPGWVFTKTLKSKTKGKTKVNTPDEATERFICERFEVSKREMNELKTFYPKEYQKWIKSIGEQLRSISK